MQTNYCTHIDKCYFGKAPTLSQINQHYGPGSAASWICPQIWNLSEYCGCRDKITASQVDQLSDIIASTYHYLKVSELMLFFYRFKMGNYGQFYGSVDPMKITMALKSFINERATAYTAHESQQRIDDFNERMKNRVTYQQYLQMKEQGLIETLP